MVTGSFLTDFDLTQVNGCEQLRYKSQIPTFGDLPKSSGVYRFCIRVELSGVEKFLLTPNFQVDYDGSSLLLAGKLISINGTDTSTNSSDVTLTLNIENQTEMYVTNQEGCLAGGIWELASKTIPWTLAQLNSIATVYVAFRDQDGNQSGCSSDSILHDNESPTGSGFKIGTGDYTSENSLTVYPSSLNAYEMYLTNSPGCLAGGIWEPYSDQRPAWELFQSNSTAAVYIKYRDEAGNETDCFSDSIVHDNTPPSNPVISDDGLTTGSSTSSQLISWASVSDQGSGISEYQFSIGSSQENPEIQNWISVGLNTQTVVNQLNPMNWGSEYKVFLRAIDHAGNISSVASSDGFLYGYAEKSYIKAPLSGSNNSLDHFGDRLDLHGDTLVVGVGREDCNQNFVTNGEEPACDDALSNSGAVWVFRNINQNWVYESHLKAPNPDIDDEFGREVAIYGDTIVVGVPGEDSNQTTITNGTTASANNSNGNSGAVYVFKRSGSVWTQEAYIKAPNNSAGDGFGNSVAIYENTIVVGAQGEDSNQTSITNGASITNDNTSTDSGAVYVFTRSGTTWSLQSYLKGVQLRPGDSFGRSVSIHEDSIAVGAPEDNCRDVIINGLVACSNNAGAGYGAVYAFKRSGTAWSQEAFLSSPRNLNGDWVGGDVAIWGDTIVAGSVGDSSNQTTITNGSTASTDFSMNDAGAAYVFTRSGSIWSQQAYLKPPNPSPFNTFASSLAIEDDLIVIGVRREGSVQSEITNGNTAANCVANNSGAAFVYERSGTSWSQKAYIKASNRDDGDEFGSDVTIFGDTIAIGAKHEDSDQVTISNQSAASTDNSLVNAGAAYIIDK